MFLFKVKGMWFYWNIHYEPGTISVNSQSWEFFSPNYRILLDLKASFRNDRILLILQAIFWEWYYSSTFERNFSEWYSSTFESKFLEFYSSWLECKSESIPPSVHAQNVAKFNHVTSDAWASRTAEVIIFQPG